MNSADLMFPVSATDSRLAPKTRVLGMIVGDRFRAYELASLANRPAPVRQQLAGAEFTLSYDHLGQSIVVTDADPRVRWVYAFWFAWYAFHPQTGTRQRALVRLRRPRRVRKRRRRGAPRRVRRFRPTLSRAFLPAPARLRSDARPESPARGPGRFGPPPCRRAPARRS